MCWHYVSVTIGLEVCIDAETNKHAIVKVRIIHWFTLQIYIGSLFRHTLAHSLDIHWLTHHEYLHI